jgi:hypothetical protein
MDQEEKEILREDFLRAPISHRLNKLAVTLGHISISARSSTEPDVIVTLLNEAWHFIEWTAPESEPKVAAELVQMQKIITMWRKSWNTARRIPQQRTLLAVQTKNWADKTAKFSKLAARL